MIPHTGARITGESLCILTVLHATLNYPWLFILVDLGQNAGLYSLWRLQIADPLPFF